MQAALLAGDSRTGVSLMKMDSGLDTGPVYAQQSLEIRPAETTGQLHDRLALLGAGLLADSLEPVLSGVLTPKPQDATGATYAGRISKQDAVIDWSADAATIARQIRAYNPWPVAETSLNGKQLRCWSASLLPDVGGADDSVPGQVQAAGPDGLDVHTGNGIVRLTEVQLPGRQRIAASDLGRSRELTGTVLGA